MDFLALIHKVDVLFKIQVCKISFFFALSDAKIHSNFLDCLVYKTNFFSGTVVN
jgi:hypothetical protein